MVLFKVVDIESWGDTARRVGGENPSTREREEFGGWLVGGPKCSSDVKRRWEWEQLDAIARVELITRFNAHKWRT